MKILHTADIHLHELDDERWKALENIINKGNSEKIDIMVIAGDLFDSSSSGDMRDSVRKLFAKAKFDTLVLPGNHDAQLLKDNIFLGENVKLLLSCGDVYEKGGAAFYPIPFSAKSASEVFELISAARHKTDAQKTNILLFHGTLKDIYFRSGSYGDESDSDYMPAALNFFDGFDYVLAGHFHSKFHIQKVAPDGYFVYPGSPVSISRKEIGIRKVNIFNTGAAPQELEMPENFHFMQIPVLLDEDTDLDGLLLQIDRRRKEAVGNGVLIPLVKGYYNKERLGLDEQQLFEKIKERLPELTQDMFEAKDVSIILEDSIYAGFLDELKGADFSHEDEGLVKKMLFEAIKGVAK